MLIRALTSKCFRAEPHGLSRTAVFHFILSPNVNFQFGLQLSECTAVPPKLGQDQLALFV